MNKQKSGKGSFRGVPFLIVEDSEQTGGHRLVQHEYPLRDDGKIENLGKKITSYQISVIVLGDNYLQLRDNLIEALEVSEAGELEHPDFKTQQVQILEWQSRVSTKAQRVVYFSITFVLSTDEVSPTAQINGAIELENNLKGLLESAIDDFTSYFDSINAVATQVAETLDYAESLVNNITQGIRSITNMSGLSNLLSSSLALKGSINNLYEAPGKVATELTDLVTAISAVPFSNSSNTTQNSASNHTSGGYTSATQNSTGNNGGHDAMQALNMITINNQQLESKNEQTNALNLLVSTAVEVNKNIIAMNDTQSVLDNSDIDRNKLCIETVSDCETFIAEQSTVLTELRIDVSDLYWYETAKDLKAFEQTFKEQMTVLSSQMPNTTKIINAQTEPALVTLYRETGASNNIQRFIRRNAIKHGSFAVGGKVLEVIHEA